MRLKDIRKKIDDINFQIYDLLNQRAQLALQIGKIKIQKDGSDTNFLRPEREHEILHALKSNNQGPLSNEALVNIFKVIMKECYQLQLNTYKNY